MVLWCFSPPPFFFFELGELFVTTTEFIEENPGRSILLLAITHVHVEKR